MKIISKPGLIHIWTNDGVKGDIAIWNYKTMSQLQNKWPRDTWIYSDKDFKILGQIIERISY